MTQLPFLTATERRFLELTKLNQPANNNCTCNVKTTPNAKVDDLLNQIAAIKVVGKTFERHHQRTLGISRNSLIHTPWLDAEVRRGR